MPCVCGCSQRNNCCGGQLFDLGFARVRKRVDVGLTYNGVKQVGHLYLEGCLLQTKHVRDMSGVGLYDALSKIC